MEGVVVIMSETEAVLEFVFHGSFQLAAQDCPELDLEREGGCMGRAMGALQAEGRMWAKGDK